MFWERQSKRIPVKAIIFFIYSCLAINVIKLMLEFAGRWAEIITFAALLI
jgi:hypothetical protein